MVYLKVCLIIWNLHVILTAVKRHYRYKLGLLRDKTNNVYVKTQFQVSLKEKNPENKTIS